jgi:hypothetical protein
VKDQGKEAETMEDPQKYPVRTVEVTLRLSVQRDPTEVEPEDEIENAVGNDELEDLAWMLDDHVKDTQEDMLAGSELFVKITEATVAGYKYATPDGDVQAFGKTA